MPHFVLEYTPQAKALLQGKDDFKPLFQQFHSTMASQGIAPAAKCKSRAYPMADFLLGEDETIGFVHLTVSYLNPPDGPLSEAKIRSVGSAIKAAVVEFFGGATDKVEFSMEMRDMPKHMYWRHTD